MRITKVHPAPISSILFSFHNLITQNIAKCAAMTDVKLVRKPHKYGKPAHVGDSKRGVPPQKGDCPPHEGGQEGSFHFVDHDLQKNQNCKKRQCLWRFMCPLSMHQFIEISICALEKKKKTFDVERPGKVCAPTATGLPVHRRRNYRAN